MAVSKTTAKTTAKKTATPAKAPTKTPAAKTPKASAAAKPAAKSAAKPAAATAKKAAATAAPRTEKRDVAPEQRRNYIEVAAYFIAERHGFTPGRELQDWAAAEAEIDRLLAAGLLNQ